MKYSAILFDLDGTLVETIHLYSQAYAATFKERGIHITPEQFENSYHSNHRIEDVFKTLGGDNTDFDLRGFRDEHYIGLLESQASFLPGAKKLLKATTHLPRAIVTGSWQTYVDAIDRKLSINKHFPVVVAADHMKPFFKPHPHGFLLAADRLGVKPEECLVVGDQLFDIDGAKAAGMQSCLIWTDFTPKDSAGKADLEASSLADVLAHII